MNRGCMWWVLLVLGGCGNHQVSAQGLDRSCDVVEDCAVVYEGDACGCDCEVAAIAATALPDYAERFTEARRGCGELPVCAPCEDVVITCEDQVCTVAE